MTRTQPLAWIPNTHGFPFTGILHSGEKVRCRVIKGDDGLHKVESTDPNVTVRLSDLRGWIR